MINVAYVCGCAYDATSLYRMVGPIQELSSRLEGEVKFTELKEISWHILGFYDIFFMQRPYEKTHVDVITEAKRIGLPVWLDYDDDLLSVPSDNPAYDTYSKPEVRKSFLQCISMADIVTVSTQTLADSIEAHRPILKNFPKIIVIPNAFNNYLFELKQNQHPREKIIMWRGSNTHVADIMSVKDDIKNIHKDFPEYSWLFMGQVPWMLRDVINKKNIIHIPSQNPIAYMGLLENIAPEVAIVPLVDSPFNRAKSNIAWQEAAVAGAVTVAPDFPEFDKMGIYKYRKDYSFYNAVKDILESDQMYRDFAVSDSREEIKRNLLLSNVNKQRVDVIKELYESV